jgi:thiamine pyrophosphokinase
MVVADGRLDDAQARLEAARAGTLVIGADGGAGQARRAGVHVDLIVGDLDSLDERTLEELVAAGGRVQRAAPDKDESDTELALLVAIESSPGPVVILGALGGGRLDHAFANLLLLAHPRLDGLDVAILDGPTTIRRIGTHAGPGAVDVEGEAGDLLTLLPIAGTVNGVTTHGLRYPLRAEPLSPGPARGLSNELLGTNASVTTEEGRLLVIHTRRSHPEAAP